MADGSPQTEDGYTRIANELLDAIVRFGFSKRQLTVLLAIARKTYGFNKKTDDMTVQQLANLTSIPRQHVSTTLSELVTIGSVLKRDGAHGYVLGINKNYGAWGDPVPKHETVPKQDVPKQDADRPKTGQLASQNRTHKRQLQKTTPKENGQTAFDQFWLAYPRKEKKQEARKAWQALKPCETLTAEIAKALTQHKRQEQWQTRKFIPHPATWLRARQWEDELTPESGGYKPQPFGVYA